MSNEINAPIAIQRLTSENCGERLADLIGLLGQLRSAATTIEIEELRAIVANRNVHIYIAATDESVAGTLTLVLTPLLSGVRARIEDVVVEGRFRRRGIAAALMKHALNAARENNALTIDLTSNPERAAANALYQSLGFKRRETNVYRFDCNG